MERCMTRLRVLFDEHGQSPWLDGLDRSCIRSGRFGEHVDAGVRGATASLATFGHSISRASDYDARIASLIKARLGVEEIYWELLIEDVTETLAILEHVYDSSGGRDGFVSIGLPPGLGHDTVGSVATVRSLHQQIDHPNLLVAVPATDAGVAAIARITAEGLSTNVTGIFSLRRYEQVISAYISGLETRPGDLSGVHGVASFLLTEVDAAADALLTRPGDQAASDLPGQAGCSLAKQAYRVFQEQFKGPRWRVLAERGANVQKPLWVSHSAAHAARPGIFYVERLIGPNTVTVMSETTLRAFQGDATLARTLDRGAEHAEAVLDRLGLMGVDLDELSADLEAHALARMTRSYEAALAALKVKANLLSS